MSPGTGPVLKLLSEPYSSAGSVVASSLTQAVRDSSLHEWAILVRETLQNSVDARLSDVPVTYRVEICKATSRQRGVLQKHVFRDIPGGLTGLSKALKSADLAVLTIADWETQGLSGPTRADLPTAEKANFCDFFLNVGREESKGYQGGTRGLGRGVLFDISAASSVVVFTRTTMRGRNVSRLLAMSIGPNFDDGERKFTGRHWWCADPTNSWPQPLEGAAAERLARELGLDVLPSDTTGTAIMVIAPRVPEGYTLEDVCDEMIQATLLYGWPLLLGRDGEPEVALEFSTGDGKAWQPLHPEHPESPVREFAKAYRQAIGDRATSLLWQRATVTFGAGRKSPQSLGTLVFRHLAKSAQSAVEEDAIPQSSVALMRDPRLIVKYLTVPPHPAGARTVGVFVADGQFDRTFAEAEPVAHDDWLPQKLGLRANERNPVKQALEKIRRVVRDSHSPKGQTAPGGGQADPIAPVVGDLLGGMLAGTEGFGGPPKPGPGGRTTRRREATRAVIGAPNLEADQGRTIASFPVHVTRAKGVETVRLRATSRVVLDSGYEDDKQRPKGASSPRVLGWDVQGAPVDGVELELPTSVSDVRVLVEQPHDTAVTVEVGAEPSA